MLVSRGENRKRGNVGQNIQSFSYIQGINFSDTYHSKETIVNILYISELLKILNTNVLNTKK